MIVIVFSVRMVRKSTVRVFRKVSAHHAILFKSYHDMSPMYSKVYLHSVSNAYCLRTHTHTHSLLNVLAFTSFDLL